MAAPFSGEEFYAKRSFFSSLLGLKFGKQTKTNASVPSVSTQQNHPHQLPPPQQFIGVDQPCSSRTILTQPIPQQNTVSIQNLPNPYVLQDGDFEGRDRSLSDQLADTLLLTSHHASPEPQQSILSPHDIYKEIVCECAHFDQQNCQPHHQHQEMHDHNYYSQQPQILQSSMPSQQQQQHLPPHHQQQQQQQQQPRNIPPYYQYSPSQIQYPIEQTNSPTYCYNCQHGNTMDNETRIKATVIEELANKTSLEDLVKLVVAAVKDAGVLGKSDKKQESPEEILRRKRQQNNEAAARYRKRQREAKMNAGNELDKLTTRNSELKAELTSLQDQINNLKNSITSPQLPKS